MKKRIVFYLIVMLILNSCSSMDNRSSDFIAITSDYGDHEYTTLVSYEDSLIQVAIDSNQVYENHMIASEFVTGKLVISQDAFKMLTKYFKDNCSALSDSVNPYPIYIITIGNRQHRCYISSNDKEAKDRYFRDLINLIESSGHKNDCQPLLKAFQYIISI